MFDPYHIWLGIPKDQRPPTCYQLLGIAPDEDDLEVIEEAAIRQTTHVRVNQIGPHARECTQVLNEIAQARATLLDPARRRAYDERLAASRPRTVPVAQPVHAAGADSASELFADLTAAESESPPPKRRPTPAARRPVWVWLGLGAGLLLLVCGGGALFFATQGGQPNQPGGGQPVGSAKGSDKSLPPVIPCFVKLPEEVRLAPGESQMITMVIDRNNKTPGIIKTGLYPQGAQLNWLKISSRNGGPNNECPEWDIQVAPGASEGEWTLQAIAQVDGQAAQGPQQIRLIVAHPRLTGETKRLLGHTQRVFAAALSRDGKKALAGAEDGKLLYWDVDSGKATTLPGHNGRVEAVTLSADGRFALSGGFDHTLRFWDLAAPSQPPREFKGHTDVITCVAFSPDGNWAVSGSLDKSVRLWDLAKGQQRGEPFQPSSTNPISCVSFNRDGTQVLCVHDEATLHVWEPARNLPEGRPLKTQHTGPVRAARFLAEGRLVISAGLKDGTVRLTDADSGKQLRVYHAEAGDELWDVASVAGGRYLLAVGLKGVLYVWQEYTGQRVRSYRDTARIYGLACTDMGSQLLSGNETGHTRLWEPLPPLPPELAAISPGTPPKVAPTKLPVPTADRFQKLVQQLEKEFAEEYDQARSKPDRRMPLADKLSERANQDRSDAARRFVLYCEARDWAARGGKIEYAGKIVESLANDYALEPSPAVLWLPILDFALDEKGYRKLDWALARVADKAGALAEETFKADLYDLSLKFLALAEKAAKGGALKVEAARYRSRTQEVQKVGEHYLQIKEVEEALRRSPNDPKANTAKGQFLALFKGDWDAALPCLARGTDGNLKALAQQEAAAPAGAADQVKLGNAWWDCAQQAKEYPTARRLTEERARRCYWIAFPRLTDKERDQLQARMVFDDQGLKLKPGLVVEFFNDPTFKKRLMVTNGFKVHARIDYQIDFDWKGGSPHSSVKADNFYLCWRGYLRAPTTGTYKLVLRSDNGSRLFVDNVFHGFLDPEATPTHQLDLKLSPKPKPIILEFVEGWGWASINLKWIPPGEQAEQPIPMDAFWHDLSQEKLLNLKR